MRIFIFGHVCIDKNVSENASYTGAGSPAMFIRKVYERLDDCTVTIVAPYGPDFLPYLDGVDIIPERPGHAKTLEYENDSRGNVRVQKARNRDEAPPVGLDPGLRQALRKADMLFFAPLLPNFSDEYVREACQAAGADALKVLLPQGYFRNFDSTDTVVPRKFSEAADILPLMDAVIASDEDYPDMENVAQDWAREMDVIFVVTRGEAGATAFAKDGRTELPTDPIPKDQVVDSVGAGDTFSAGFAYEYERSGDVRKAGTFANRLAREKLFRAEE